MARPQLSDVDQRALAAVAVQFFVNGAMTASFIARAPQIRDRIGVSVDEFGLLLTIGAGAGLVGSLMAGRVIHRWSTKRVLEIGAVLLSASLLLIGGATEPAVYLAGMLAYTFVDVFVDISMNLQGSWISARRHTPVVNRLHGLWSLGTLTGGLGAAVANAAGMSPFVHLGIVAVVMLTVLAIATPRLLPSDEEGHADAPAPAPAAPGRRARLAPVVLLVLAGMFAVVIEMTGMDWATFRLADDFGASAAVASLAFAAGTFGMTAMRFGGDFLQVRLGRMGLHRLSVGLAAIGLFAASLVPSEAVSLIGFLFLGLGVATFMPRIYDDAARLPGRRGAGLGAMTAGMRLAYLGTPVLVGGLAGTSLSVGDAIAIVTLPAIIGFAIVTEWNERLLLRRRAGVAANAGWPSTTA